MIQAGADVPTQEDRVIVAVLDTGLWPDPDTFPPERLAPGYDFVQEDGDPLDDNGHGTHIASLIAGAPGGPSPGLCPECNILPIKVLDSLGEGTPGDVARGIRFAIHHGARVLNLSMGYPAGCEGAAEVARAVAEALRAGVVIVASVGNEGRIGVSEPASLPGVLAVASVDSTGRRARYSNLSLRVDIAAPGGDDSDRNGDSIPDAIASTSLTRRFPSSWEPAPEIWLFSGTSQATAQVSALAGRLVAMGLTAEHARAIILATARDDTLRGFDAGTGFGIIQFKEALEMAQTGEEPPHREGLQATMVSSGGPGAGTWTALVRDTASGLPVPGATVYVSWPGDPLTVRSAVTGPDGIAEVPPPDPHHASPPLVVRVVARGRPFDPEEFSSRDRETSPSGGLIAAPLRRLLEESAGTARAVVAGGS